MVTSITNWTRWGPPNSRRHLEKCSECVAALEALESLRSTINVAQLYEKAPAALRKKVITSIRSQNTGFSIPARASWRGLALAAAIILFCYVGWNALSLRRAENSETVLTAELVDAHLRSLQPGHLVDVISSDQHTVKPWFAGKLNFSPPVRDFADRGFPLQGGRLDVVHGRSVAALVYGRRKHVVNLFIWPTNEPDVRPREGSQQGYHWLDWRTGGMELCIVSDAAASDLEQLQRIFVQ